MSLFQFSTSKRIDINTSYCAKQKGKKVFVWLLRWAFLLSVGYIVLLPLFSMITYSFMPREQMYDPEVVWIPKSITFDNLVTAFNKLDYPSSFMRTVLFEIGAGLVQALMATLAAYGMARFRFRMKKVYIALLMLTIFIPTPMIIVSLFSNFNNFDMFGILGLVDTLFHVDLRPDLLNTAWTFYLPSFFSVGLNSGLCIFIYMQFFKGLPFELEDAAYIDGAGPLRAFVSIILPSSSVVLRTVIIFSVIWHWNDYYLAIMYLNNDFTLATQLAMALQSPDKAVTSALVQMAGCLLFVIPVLIFYMIIQRKFIQSIDRVGIVG